MTDLPVISVIIATRNRAPSLKRMLDRLFEDDYPALQVILVDGASTDNTVEVIQSYGGKITRWISEPDGGEYFAVNKGLAMATGDIVKFMSDDDELRPGSFRLAAEYFQQHPDVEIVFGKTSFWEDGPAGSVPAMTHIAERFDAYSRNPDRLSLKHWLRDIAPLHGLQSLAGFIRRRVFDTIGPLSTEFACGDVEFWARAARQGIRMDMMPQTVLDYHITGDNGVFTKRTRIEADMVRINARHGSPLDVGLCLARRQAPSMWAWFKRKVAAALRLGGARRYVLNHIVAKIPFYAVRHWCYRQGNFIQLGPGSSVHLNVFVTGYGIRVGAHSTINRRCFLDGRAPLRIGDCVSISPDVQIITAQHDMDDPGFANVFGAITIEDYVWIGTRAIILPGCTLGRGCVVGAGSVVTRDVPPWTFVAGVPARPIRQRQNAEAMRYTCDWLPPFD